MKPYLEPFKEEIDAARWTIFSLESRIVKMVCDAVQDEFKSFGSSEINCIGADVRRELGMEQVTMEELCGTKWK